MSKKVLAFIMLFVFSIHLFATKVSKEECLSKSASFIFAGGECIQYYEAQGDVENTLNIIVHGAWKKGTNTLARYTPFAQNIAMSTDITSIAVALPGYSKSSTNKFGALIGQNGKPSLAADKEYIVFMTDLIIELKEKYKASTINYIGHSAGAMLGLTITGYKPKLIQNMMSAGGVYDVQKNMEDNDDLISITNVIDTVDKDTKFLLIYGTKDTVSKPKLTKDFYTLAIQKGLNIKLVKVEGAPHLDLDMADTSVDAIIELLDD